MSATPTNPPQAVVLLDLDGTVLDGANQVHTSLVPALKRARADGIMLGWASSTSDKGLVCWERLLGIPSGLLVIRVSEDGVRITGPPGFLTKSSGTERGQQLLLADHGRWKTMFGHVRGFVRGQAARAHWGYVETHPSTWAEVTTHFPAAHPAVLVVDVTRTASFTAEVRAISTATNELRKDPYLTTLARGWVAAAARRHGVPTQLLDSGTGWVDLPHPTARKQQAMVALRQAITRRWSADVPLVLVGNGHNDLVAADGVRLVAVANACQALKNVADQVTTKPFSEGVVEYLQQFSA